MIQRRMRPAYRRSRFKTASLIVSLNLEINNRQPARWVEVRLVFSTPVRAGVQLTVSGVIEEDEFGG